MRPTILASPLRRADETRRPPSSKRSLHTGGASRQIEQADTDLVFLAVARQRAVDHIVELVRPQAIIARESGARWRGASAPSARSRRTSGSARAPAPISWLSDSARLSLPSGPVARNGSTPTRSRLRFGSGIRAFGASVARRRQEPQCLLVLSSRPLNMRIAS